MSKTFKVGFIYFLCISLFLFLRLSVSFIELADNYLDWLFSFIGQVLIFGVIPIWLYKKYVDSEPGSVKRDFRIRFNIHPLSYIIAIVLGVVVFIMTMIINGIYANILIALGYQYNISIGTIYSHEIVLVMQLLTVAVFPGIFEEITNRGLLMKALGNIKNEKVIIIVTGIFFGLFHQFIAQFGYAVFGGIIFAIIVLRTGSIIPAMIMHFMNNALSIMLGYTSQKNLPFYDYFETGFYFVFSNIFYVLLLFAFLAFVLDKSIRALKMLNSRQIEEYKIIFSNYTTEKGVILKLEKTRWWEYGFLYSAFVTMTITTVASFLWNFNL